MCASRGRRLLPLLRSSNGQPLAERVVPAARFCTQVHDTASSSSSSSVSSSHNGNSNHNNNNNNNKNINNNNNNNHNSASSSSLKQPSLFDGSFCSTSTSARFPLAAGLVPLPGGRLASAEEVLAAVGPLLREERLMAMRRVVRGRTFDLLPVLEGLDNDANVAAVLRTAEGLGLGAACEVPPPTAQLGAGVARRRPCRGVSRGAEKWLFRSQWSSTGDCLTHLRLAGFQQFVALAPHGRVGIHDVDWTLPTAIFLGSEVDGLSEEAKVAATHLVSLHSPGFAGSFNVGAAAAMALHAAVEARRAVRNGVPDLSEAEQELLVAHFAARSLPLRQLRAALLRASL
ncbi:unnamed protein product [Polarella glacialis]|uniref:tRNA/rRNA methyltransferase SpoU type domain-containing protein n=1 Tax=Polarella glacialis TaxID=89957 RepID=A0A813FX02_POLGL|nr:unnamed protein product [Polarella glacialis]